MASSRTPALAGPAGDSGSDSEDYGPPSRRARARAGASGSGVARERTPSPVREYKSRPVQGEQVGPYGLWVNTDAPNEPRRRNPRSSRFTREVLLRERVNRAFALFELTEAPALARKEAKEASDAVKFMQKSRNDEPHILHRQLTVSRVQPGTIELRNYVMEVANQWMAGPQNHDFRVDIETKDLTFSLNIARARPEMYVTEAVAYGWQVYGFVRPRDEISEVFVDFFYRCLEPNRRFTRELMGVLEDGVLDDPLDRIVQAHRVMLEQREVDREVERLKARARGRDEDSS